MSFTSQVCQFSCLISICYRMTDMELRIEFYRYWWRSNRGRYICKISLQQWMVDIVLTTESHGIDPTSAAISALHQNTDIKTMSNGIFTQALSTLKSDMCHNGIPPLGVSKTMIIVMMMMMMMTDTNRLELWLGFIPEYLFDQYTGLPYVWSTGNNHIH